MRKRFIKYVNHNIGIRFVILLMTFILFLPVLAGCSPSEASGTTAATTRILPFETTNVTVVQPIELTLPKSDSQLFVYMELEEDRVYQIDLNSDGEKDELACRTKKNSSGERETTILVNDTSILSETIHWGGGIYLVDIDENDGYLDLAIQHLGELSWAQTAFICYDGERLINRGVVQSNNENQGDIQPPDRLGDIRLDGMGDLIAITRSDFLMTWFYEETWRINAEGLLEIVPKDFYPVPLQREAIELVLKMDLPLYAEPEASETVMTVKVGDTVTFLGTDKKAWVQVRTEQGDLGWFRVINKFEIEVGSIIFNGWEVFGGLYVAE